MATIISHAAVPLALGIGLGEKCIPRRLLAAGVLASMLPDADVILFRFGATYDGPLAHRGFSHSLGFAILLGLFAALAMRRLAPALVAFAFVALSAASHGLLDMLTNGGHGIAILWPASDHRYFFDWRPIQVSPLVPSRFATRAAAVVKTELMWVWLPGIAVAAGLRLVFARRSLERAFRRTHMAAGR
jgi:inner membrane protein